MKNLFFFTKHKKISSNKKFVKNNLLKKELRSNEIFEKTFNSDIKAFKNSFLGLWNQQIIYNVEKSIINYKKILLLVRFFDFFKLQILFLGSPTILELFFKSLSLQTRHIFLLNEYWIPGVLTNEKIFPMLILYFKEESSFSKREILKKLIPLACFVELSKGNALSNSDYIVFLNLESSATVKIFFMFFKQLILNKDGKR